MPDLIDEIMGGPVADLLAEFGGQAVVIHKGAECVCGNGSCWIDEGLGGYGGWCRADKHEKRPELPPCPHCGAQNQGTQRADGRPLCWSCCEYHEPPYRLSANIEG